MYPEINSLHLKIDGLEDDISFLGARPIFRGKLAARFRTCFSCMADQLLRKIPNLKGNSFFPKRLLKFTSIGDDETQLRMTTIPLIFPYQYEIPVATDWGGQK